MSGSLDATSLLWHTREPKAGGGMQSVEQYPTHVLRGHSDAVLCVALSSVMRLAASGSRDGGSVRTSGVRTSAASESTGTMPP